MARKVLIRLTCRVCGKVRQSYQYLGRWSNATPYYGSTGAEYKAEQVCSNECLDIEQERIQKKEVRSG